MKENCSSELYLQVCFKYIAIYYEVIFQSMTGPDDNGQGNLPE